MTTNQAKGVNVVAVACPRKPLNELGTDAIQEQEHGARVPEIVAVDVGEDAFRFLTYSGVHLY